MEKSASLSGCDQHICDKILLAGDFLEFEEKIITTLRKMFEESLIRNIDPEANRTLEEIQWNKLAEEDISLMKDEKLTVIQQLFNETLPHIYFGLDVNQLIDRIQNIDNDTESNKIYKV